MKEEGGKQGKQRHTCERVREKLSKPTQKPGPFDPKLTRPYLAILATPPVKLGTNLKLEDRPSYPVVIVAESRRDRRRFKLEKPRPKPIPLPLILLEFDHATTSLLFPTTPSSIPDHLQSPGVTVSPPANCWKFTASLPHVGPHRRHY